MAGHIDRGLFGWRWPRTPVTPSGLRGMDQLPPDEALVRAWTTPGRNPAWHRLTVRVVRDAMPLLARALDRLAKPQKPYPMGGQTNVDFHCNCGKHYVFGFHQFAGITCTCGREWAWRVHARYRPDLSPKGDVNEGP